MIGNVCNIAHNDGKVYTTQISDKNGNVFMHERCYRNNTMLLLKYDSVELSMEIQLPFPIGQSCWLSGCFIV